MGSRKGIILAGGTGRRLLPNTIAVSKQLLPVFDKPMIYYPLSVLLLAGIRDIALITTPRDQPQFRRLLGDGSQWGIRLAYIVQPAPEGVAQGYILAERFLAGAASALILGDNIFHGAGMQNLLAQADEHKHGATVFACHVPDPQRYGVVQNDAWGQVTGIIEKPAKPPSDLAVTGLYFLDETAPARARNLRPSARGELEISTLLNSYLPQQHLRVETLDASCAWFDAGTPASLLEAANFVRRQQKIQGAPVCNPDDIVAGLNRVTAGAANGRAAPVSDGASAGEVWSPDPRLARQVPAPWKSVSQVYRDALKIV
ncbi:sugar nucleotidyltransferase [Candidatus Halocynthiibacter alkanivorans]|uniref:sugar nucleotidyltransferase n=1 Tax=Candidatus Halocynthiibacter alkanivorans TaxID=2267619 RepID=UPI000DF47F31|nr:sugar phosphate nucleotidyltransferase [Candidatus Halocynthiibacter alkanivorans]